MTARILLVEDEIAHVELIRRAFNDVQHGFHLEVVHTLADAQHRIKQAPPDLVFVDFLLPDGRGTDLLHKNGSSPAFPLVMLTSHGNEQIAVESMKAGALDYVVKSESIFAQMPHIARRTLREWDHITKHRNAERELRESEEKFRKMLESAAEGILLIDETGYIRLVNQHIEHISGFDREELLNQPIEVLIPQRYQPGHIQHRQAFIAQAESRKMAMDYEVIAQRKDGSEFPAEVSLTSIMISGKRHVMCFVMDVTERKQLQEQQIYARALEVELEKEREIIELKERFMSMVSHDFKTPLAIMLSSVDIIRRYFDKLPKEKVIDRLDNISYQIQDMVTMIEDVLTITRGHAGKLVPNPEPLYINSLCRQIVENVQMADPESHAFIFDADGVPDILRADRRLVERIFTNLLTNAVKYSPAGSRIIFRIRHEGSCFIFDVTDEGIGIPEEDQPRLFEPFHRARNAEYSAGTGLGLAIVKQSVDAQGGQITFTSREGHGSRFTVSLPDRH